jgi:hypothetical protein
LRVPIAMRAFYEQSLRILQSFLAYVSRLAPRAARLFVEPNDLLDVELT